MATVKDVICSMDIDLKTAAAKTGYRGKTYYFCAEMCREKFKAESDKYAL